MAEKATAKATATTSATYTVEEYAKTPKILGVESPDIVTAAFKVKGKKEATIDEAKKIVKEYAGKEIK